MVRLRLNRGPSEKPESAPRPDETTSAAPIATATPPPVFASVVASYDDHEFIQAVQQRLLAEPDPPRARLEVEPDYFQRRIAAITTELIEQSERVVSERERARLVQLAQADILGYGPIEQFLHDDSVTEIMVNGPKQVWVERGGRLYETGVSFIDDEHVRRIISRIIAPLGRRCDDSSPMVDARLPDGSRVNAIIPPLCLNGPSLTIRKFSRQPLTVDDLIRGGSLTAEVAEFLKACVEAQLNIVVSGGTGTGKTTLLNVLSSFIPDDERIVTIKNAAELKLMQRHVVTLESRPANLEGRGEVSIRDLVINSLRMRPNRIVVGECRGGEALDMLQAMNTGHDGSMTTIHANTARDALARMETMVLMAGMDLPARAIREQIAAAVQIVVQIERHKDGSRKLGRICEITGMEGDVITMSDLFVFKHNEGLRRKLARADVPLTVPEYVLLKIAATLLPAAIALVVSRSLLAVPPLALIGFFAPTLWLQLRQRRRQRLFSDQLPEMLATLIGSLRGGFSLVQSLGNVANEAPAPMSTEMRRVMQEVQLGLSIGDALGNLARRMASDDLDLVVSVLRIHARIGGNLTTVLENINATIRERTRLHREIRVITAQQRYAAYVLGLLPVVLGLILLTINPDYLLQLFQPGPILIIPVAAAILNVIGFLVIMRVVDIKV